VNSKMNLKTALAIASLLTFNAFAFDAGEHALIGDTAYNKASQNYPNKITNLEMGVSYSYGQLVAMSGDMYRSIEEIALDDSALMSGFYKRNRGSLKKCVDKEVDAIRNLKVYAGCDDVRFATKKLRYVTLAGDNFTHFAWHNIKTYIDLHGKALWFAKLAHLKCTDDEKKQDKARCKQQNNELKAEVASSDYDKKLGWKYRKTPKLFPRKKFSQRYFINMTKDKMTRLALFANAYADHYLSDSFSAGHLRVPRSQIDNFVDDFENANKAQKKKKREEGSSVSGALTQFLHNNDGTMTGIEVINSLGDTFIIRSDKQLFALAGSSELSNVVEENSQLVQPVIAAQKSLKEVLDVLAQGEKAMPKGAYTALYNVPFIVDDKNSLKAVIDKNIADKGSIKKAIKSMSSEMQLVFKSNMVFGDITYKEYFAQFVAGIPKLMEKLRAQINRESEDVAIKSRIPEVLMKALRKIN
jgi:hypothetical protein